MVAFILFYSVSSEDRGLSSHGMKGMFASGMGMGLSLDKIDTLSSSSVTDGCIHHQQQQQQHADSPAQSIHAVNPTTFSNFASRSYNSAADKDYNDVTSTSASGAHPPHKPTKRIMRRSRHVPSRSVVNRDKQRQVGARAAEKEEEELIEKATTESEVELGDFSPSASASASASTSVIPIKTFRLDNNEPLETPASLVSHDDNKDSAKKERIKPSVIFVLGGPASGKGTQCAKISDEFGIQHLSIGDLLRRAAGTATGALIDERIREGKLVDSKIVITLLKEAMLSSNSDIFLIDGFPRNSDNVHNWKESMTDLFDIEGLWFIDTSQEEMLRRLLNRGTNSGRSDDNIDSAKKRFAIYSETTMPIIDYFNKLNKVRRVNGDESIDDVFQILKVLGAGSVEKMLLNKNRILSQAIMTSDWETYSSLCDDNMSSFEGGTLVEGISYHELSFKMGAYEKSPSIEQTMIDPHVRLIGHTAIFTCIREVLNSATRQSKLIEETRIWRIADKDRGAWKLVHLHSQTLRKED